MAWRSAYLRRSGRFERVGGLASESRGAPLLTEGAKCGFGRNFAIGSIPLQSPPQGSAERHSDSPKVLRIPWQAPSTSFPGHPQAGWTEPSVEKL